MTTAALSRRPAPARRMIAIVVAAAAALSATACGGPSGAGGGSDTATARVDPAAAAAQDAAFATAMFEHRHQALQLLGLVAANAESSDVLEYAGDLQISYDNQMRELEDLLTTWGKPVPHVEGHSDLGEDIPGLLDSSRLEQLLAAEPADFEKQFLAILSEHEKAAVPIAEQQLRAGAAQQAKEYAQEVLQDTTTQLDALGRLAQS